MSKIINNIKELLPTLISIIALTFTALLTIHNISYFKQQRYDTLNRFIYEKKYDAAVAITTSFKNYLDLFPLQISFSDTIFGGVLTDEQYEAINTGFDELVINERIKWVLVLPVEVMDEYTKLVVSSLHLYLKSAELKGLSENNNLANRDSIYSLQIQINSIKENLKQDLFNFTNSYRDNLGIDELNDEMITIFESINSKFYKK